MMRLFGITFIEIRCRRHTSVSIERNTEIHPVWNRWPFMENRSMVCVT